MPDSASDNHDRQAADFIVDIASMFSSGPLATGYRSDERNNGAAPASTSTVTLPGRRPAGERTVAAYELALEVAGEGTVPAMLRRLVDGAREIVGAGYGALVFSNPDSPDATVMFAGIPPEQHADGVPGGGERLLAGRSMPVEPMLIREAMKSPLLGTLPEGHASISSIVGVPLHSGERQVGYLLGVNKADGGAFGEPDLHAFELLSRHASTAIGRAQAERGLAMGQHRIETQLSQLRMVLDTLPAGVLVLVPPLGRVELANETALSIILGNKHEAASALEVYRDFDWMRADGTELPRSHHPGMLALRGEMIGNRALTLQTKNGDHVPVRVQSTPIYGPSGEITRAVVLFLDVSKERAAEQVKDDFLSLISHEFRTPLTAIHGGALLLSQQGEIMDPETRHELLQDIGEESARLDRMLGNLLSVSEIMAGRFQAVTEPILVAPLVQPLLDEFREKSPHHEFSLEVTPGVPPAEGTPELLIQILRNLYENAVKYSPGGGEIRTVISQRGGAVSIEVIDNGLGISAEHVPHVFERFRRPGAEPTVRGMGLGLYLSRLLVDAQGGQIRASSPGPGKGATFLVELPMVPDWEHDNGVESE